MSPTPTRRTPGTPGSQETSQPIGAAAPTVRLTVDYTDQSNFSADTDASPYATAKSAKRAEKAMGKSKAGKSPAKGKVAQPKYMHVVPDPRDARQPAPIPGVFPGAETPAPHPAASPAQTQFPAVPANPTYPHLRVIPTDDPDATAEFSRMQRSSEQRRAAVKAAGIPDPRQPERPEPFGVPAPAPVAGGTPWQAQGLDRAYAPAAQRPSAGQGNVARPKPAPQKAKAQGPNRPSIPTPKPVPPRSVAKAVKWATKKRSVSTEATWRHRAVAATGFICFALVIAMLYIPAKQFYVAVRQNERLASELEMSNARVAALEASVSSLQTAEGIQDAAHDMWGIVLPGEVYVTVHNAASAPEDNGIPDEVKRGSGTNTTNALTDLLDHVFGTTSATNATASSSGPATISETPRS